MLIRLFDRPINGISYEFAQQQDLDQASYSGNFRPDGDLTVLEATWLGYSKPYTTKKIGSMVAQMMVKTGQNKMIEDYGLSPFDVRVLEPIRTICEKIMSLVRFSYTDNPVDDLKQKVRHAYDLHQLLKDKGLHEFIESEDFIELLLKVAQDDVVSFKNNNDWLSHHPVDALIFKDLNRVWKELIPVYNGEFSKLVYGTLPNERDIYDTLDFLKKRLAQFEWKLKLN